MDCTHNWVSCEQHIEGWMIFPTSYLFLYSTVTEHTLTSLPVVKYLLEKCTQSTKKTQKSSKTCNWNIGIELFYKRCCETFLMYY